MLASSYPGSFCFSSPRLLVNSARTPGLVLKTKWRCAEINAGKEDNCSLARPCHTAGTVNVPKLLQYARHGESGFCIPGLSNNTIRQDTSSAKKNCARRRVLRYLKQMFHSTKTLMLGLNNNKNNKCPVQVMRSSSWWSGPLILPLCQRGHVEQSRTKSTNTACTPLQLSLSSEPCTR